VWRGIGGSRWRHAWRLFLSERDIPAQKANSEQYEIP
jgi:hypothetical protein